MAIAPGRPARPWRSLAPILLAVALCALVGCDNSGGAGQAIDSPSSPVKETARASSTLSAEQVPVTPRPATPISTPTTEIAQLEREVVERINEIRQERGLEPLQVDQDLARIAHDYSCRMARQDFFAHVSPSGQTVADRVSEAGIRYRLVGENLALIQGAAQPVARAVEGWMESPGHRENILREAFTRTGVGICREDETYYFTQIFLQPA